MKKISSKAANGIVVRSGKLIISKRQWEAIGKEAGWAAPGPMLEKSLFEFYSGVWLCR